MKRTIKFSNWYKKFDNLPLYSKRGNYSARLLQAIKIHYNDLSKYLIVYDTQYQNDKMYKLPKTDLILLIFWTGDVESQGIFTTIRRFTSKKWDYYKQSEGELFDIDLN